MPDWMDKEEARRKMKEMGKAGVQYGEKESYREFARETGGREMERADFLDFDGILFGFR